MGQKHHITPLLRFFFKYRKSLLRLLNNETSKKLYRTQSVTIHWRGVLTRTFSVTFSFSTLDCSEVVPVAFTNRGFTGTFYKTQYTTNQTVHYKYNYTFNSARKKSIHDYTLLKIDTINAKMNRQETLTFLAHLQPSDVFTADRWGCNEYQCAQQCFGFQLHHMQEDTYLFVFEDLFACDSRPVTDVTERCSGGIRRRPRLDSGAG